MKYSEQYEGTLQTQSVHFHSNRSLTRHIGSFFLFVAFDNFELFLGVPRGARALLAGGGGRAHRREVLGVAQVEGAARGGALQRRAQLAAALRICAHALLQTRPAGAAHFRPAIRTGRPGGARTVQTWAKINVATIAKLENVVMSTLVTNSVQITRVKLV